MIYFCCDDDRRRNAIKNQSLINGIDFLEVSDDPRDASDVRQHTLFVHFIKDLAPGALWLENVRIEGGERIRQIHLTRVTTGAPAPNVLKIEVQAPGDFSTYTLRLVTDARHAEPPPGFDVLLSAIDFSFKVACPSDFDCHTPRVCPAEAEATPEINYLAKDYASFRQLMLDRIATLAPVWTERNPADLGIALVELLTYVGDYLSYQQDAVATESYLGTARRRISVRRHARLVDYLIDDGANARTWVQVRVRHDVNNLLLRKSAGAQPTKLLTRVEGQSALVSLNSSAFERALIARPQVFELLHDLTLFAAHNEMRFYTWGARECCLPKGATRATLHGSFPNLKAGDVLIFREARGPDTGQPGDADPFRRHAVRLQTVSLASDPVGGQFETPAHNDAVAVTEIEWSPADALPFPLCISARRGTAYFDDVSGALGNIVLADHGLTITDELLPEAPVANPVLTKVRSSERERCESRAVELTPARFRPTLAQSPVTHAAPYDAQHPPDSATAAMRWSRGTPLPAVTLAESGVAERWQPQRDLLNSHSGAREFVAEVETDGTTYLRFGDDQLGARPAAGTRFAATYRVGNGTAGNIGAESIAHLASADPALVSDLSAPLILSVSNPLPAQGGSDPESIERIRQNAPSAFRTQERAVTADDYAVVAGRCRADVQRAAATFRWTGSWRTVFLTADRVGGDEVDADFERELRACLERYRMAGHDVEVDAPRYVSLEVEMIVCVKPSYLVSDVKAALLAAFSNRTLPDGRRGVFHPDNFSFGQPVYVSRLFAAAQGTAGVDSVDITKFQRQGIDSDEALKSGKLELGRLEIARLDNDPDFRERGVFNLNMRRGR
ncbi:MAG: putative baseplate assembly protein [Pyrinomonadaceae bacterium]